MNKVLHCLFQFWSEVSNVIVQLKVENLKTDNSGTVVILHTVNHQSEIQELLRYLKKNLPFFVFTALKSDLMSVNDRLTNSEKEIVCLKNNAGSYS